MANTGTIEYTNRQLYFVEDDTPVSPIVTEANANDADYVEPATDHSTCPPPIAVVNKQVNNTNDGIATCQAGTSFVTKYLDTTLTPQIGDIYYNEDPGETRYNGGGYWHYYDGDFVVQHRIELDGRIADIYTGC